ncbi:MAG TPA: hypothetical protein VGP55_04655 [Chitinophagaceae bacterium]|nr:hypothetical protein [Chitinophagaceae bacterium]
MKKIIFFAFVLSAGCNSYTSEDQSKKTIKDTSSVSKKDAPMPFIIPGCYAWVAKKDSALLSLDISGNKVSGNLNYVLYQKDNNKGIINGILQDSLIIADYTFQSEGMTSVRQVVFKLHGNSLIEGFGDIDMKGDTARFKNISQLQFQEERPFIKTDCK